MLPVLRTQHKVLHLFLVIHKARFFNHFFAFKLTDILAGVLISILEREKLRTRN